MKFILTNFGDNASIQSIYVNADGKLGPHVHQFIEICFVREGTAEIIVDGEKRVLHRGEFAVIHPFRVHFISVGSDGRIWVGVFSDKTLNGFGTQTSEYVWGEDFCFCGSDSLALYVENHLPPESDRTLVDPGSVLLYNVRGLFYAVMDEFTRKVPRSEKPNYTSALAKIYEYVENHFSENIGIKEISSALGYSPKYISHTLSSIPDSSFRKILNSRRVTNAKWWLLNSEKKVLEIALLVGYPQERTFYRAFKDETNMTPYAYRKKYKKE